MKRTRSKARAPVPVTPSKSSPPSPPIPAKKTKCLTARQMKAAFRHVTKPVVTATTPSPTKATPPPPPITAPPPIVAPPPKAASPTRAGPPPKTQSSAVPPSTPPPKSSQKPQIDLLWAPKRKANSRPQEKSSPPPPPSVTPEAAEILSQIDPLRITSNYLKSDLFQASVLSPSSPDYLTISEYITNSQAHGFKIEPLSILKIIRPPPRPFIPASATQDTITAPAPPPNPFTMMLWHGTRPQVVSSILSNGFICPSTGKQMFGQGVYFADRISKSSQYCHPTLYCSIPKAGDVGYLFLCQVVLGKIYNAKKSNSEYKSAPTAKRYDGSVMTFDSLMCTGAQVPDREKQREIDGVTWPLGPTIQNKKFPSYTVNYNEYIVYKPAEMVDIKYLVKVKFS